MQKKHKFSMLLILDNQSNFFRKFKRDFLNICESAYNKNFPIVDGFGIIGQNGQDRSEFISRSCHFH